MFGYVTPLKSELKVREFEYFRSYYCGLCHEIKREYGNIPRFCLNYDLTFIGFLLEGLYSEPLKLQYVKCLKHPTSKLIIADKTKALNYSCNLSILFFNYKLKDNIIDDKSIKSSLFKLLLSPSVKKNLLLINDIASHIDVNINNLSALENNKNFSTLDEICQPFSDTMGVILKAFPYDIENDSLELRENLYWLGYYLGKWIYLIDALDDLKDDIYQNKFNPYNIIYNSKNLNYSELLKNNIVNIDFYISNCISNCIDYMNKIPFKKHFDIINNTINLGLLGKYYEILNKLEVLDYIVK